MTSYIYHIHLVYINIYLMSLGEASPLEVVNPDSLPQLWTLLAMHTGLHGLYVIQRAPHVTGDCWTLGDGTGRGPDPSPGESWFDSAWRETCRRHV